MISDLTDQSWRSRFVLSSEARTPGERRALERNAGAGQLLRPHRGVYATPPPEPAYPRDRHLDLVRALHLLAPHTIFSHQSAAAVWGLPRIGSWPTKVHTVDREASGGRSQTAIHRHSTGRPVEFEEVGGIRVTSLATTVIDLARTDSTMSAVTSTDDALRGTTLPSGVRLAVDQDVLLEMLVELGPVRGIRAAEWVIRFADRASDSPGESGSRVQIDRLGFPPPILQVEFRDARGVMRVDFWWPHCNLVGEFDGYGKYLRHAPAVGQSEADAAMAEKDRENRIRRLGPTVARWGWDEMLNRTTLAETLRDGGMR